MSDDGRAEGLRSQMVGPQIMSAPAACACVDGDWFAAPDGRRGEVLLWGGVSGGHLHQPVRLTGLHVSRVTALRFALAGSDARGGGSALYSASADGVVRWDMHQLQGEVSALQSDGVRGHIIAHFESAPLHLAVSRAGDRLAVCEGAFTHVVDVRSGHVVARLEGHSAAVSAAEFREGEDGNLRVVSVAEDRRFLIFDITSRSLVYQSAIVSASPFMSLAVESGGSRCAVGTTDGKVRVYDLSKQDHRLLQTLDVPALAGLQDRPWHRKSSEPVGEGEGEVVVISSEPAWKRVMDAQAALAEEDVEATSLSDRAYRQCPVISLAFCPAAATIASKHHEGDPEEGFTMYAAAGQNTSSNELADMLRRAPSLVIATPSCVLVSSTITGELVRAVWLEAGDMPQTNVGSVKLWERLPVGTVGCVAMASHTSGGLLLLASPAFTPDLHLILIPAPAAPSFASRGGPRAFFIAAEGVVASVFPSRQPPKGSLLCQEKDTDASRAIPGKHVQQSGGRDTLGSIMRNSGVVRNQPLTFHAKVKSSSYGASAPTMTMFGIKTASKKPPARSSSSKGASSLVKAYPSEADVPRHRQGEVDAHGPQHSAPIRRICFSGDASKLASASADKTVCVLRAPLRKTAGEGSFLTGHTGPVNTVAWSHDCKLLISSAADRTVRIWSPEQSTCEALLVMDRKKHQRKVGVTKQEEEANPVFSVDIRDAAFFYMDRFVVAAVGKNLLVYSYSLADTDVKGKDDIERLKKKHKYKLAACLETKAQSVSAMACANGFLSHIILAAGSHKHVEVWDVAAEKCIHTFEDVHEKPAHCLRLNGGGAFSSHPAESYDLFLTVSTGDRSVHMWDLRTAKRVCKLAGHGNRVHPIGASFSPCLRYVACGSEDKQAYVYDIRNGSGTFMERLGGHTDVVTDVCFNPLHPQMVTACNDGKIRSFVDKE